MGAYCLDSEENEKGKPPIFALSVTLG
jgi:hypothetical protein